MSNSILLTEKAVLVLSDGSRFDGYVFAAVTRAVGELVIETELVGYQETLSDQANADKIVLFTTPHIGNTGVNDEDAGGAIAVAGMIVRDPARKVSNFRSTRSLTDDLLAANIPAICGVDTRAITRRSRGKKLTVGIFSGADLQLSEDEQLRIVTSNETVGA